MGRTPLYIEAAIKFRTMLREGELGLVAGDSVSIADIEQATGTSHNTAYEALKFLADHGEILIQPRRASTVLPAPEVDWAKGYAERGALVGEIKSTIGTLSRQLEQLNSNLND
jgi:DNA-binding GntR family transcriptional regulator